MTTSQGPSLARPTTGDAPANKPSTPPSPLSKHATAARLGRRCKTSSSKKNLLKVLVQADWKCRKRMLRPRRLVKGKGQPASSSSAGLGPLHVQKERIQAAAQQAIESQGLGSTMASIRSNVSDCTGIDCSNGAAKMICDKAILKWMRARKADNPPFRRVPVFVSAVLSQQAADLHREWVAMDAADGESQAYERELHFQATGQRPRFR